MKHPLATKSSLSPALIVCDSVPFYTSTQTRRRLQSFVFLESLKTSLRNTQQRNELLFPFAEHLMLTVTVYCHFVCNWEFGH